MKKCILYALVVGILLVLGGCTEDTKKPDVKESTTTVINESVATEPSRPETVTTEPSRPETVTTAPTDAETPCDHSWQEATCTAPKTCTQCGMTEGSAADHSWKTANCTEPTTCTKCGGAKGSPKGHSWENATCTTPKTCTVCSATEGDVAHDFSGGICTSCNTTKIGLELDNPYYVISYGEEDTTISVNVFSGNIIYISCVFSTDPSWEFCTDEPPLYYQGKVFYKFGVGNDFPSTFTITDTEIIACYNLSGAVEMKFVVDEAGNLVVTYKNQGEPGEVWLKTLDGVEIAEP